MILLPILWKLIFFAAGLFGIGFLITIHEFGHFIFCKLFGVSVPSFSIGFGPAIWEKKIGETVFSLSIIPLGGYVEMAGSAEVGQGEQKEAYRDDEYSIINKPYWQKMLILFGGITCNLLFAYITFIVIMALGAPGNQFLPESLTTTIASVNPESSAEKAGLQPGDRVIALDGALLDFNKPEAFVEKLQDSLGKTVPLIIERNGIQENLPITLDTDKKASPLGICWAFQPVAPKPIIQAIKEGIALTNRYITNTAYFIVQLFKKRNLTGASGPVGIISMSMTCAQEGVKIYLLLLAIISISLAVFNLLPLPILDGGQAFMYTIEAIIRRRLPDNIKLAIHLACWALFLILTIYITYYDIKRIILSLL